MKVGGKRPVIAQGLAFWWFRRFYVFCFVRERVKGMFYLNAGCHILARQLTAAILQL